MGRLQLCTSYVNMLKVAGPGTAWQRAVGREGQTVESEAVHRKGHGLFYPDHVSHHHSVAGNKTEAVPMVVGVTDLWEIQTLNS